MPEEYWDEIRGIGKLYVEEELVVGIEPVLLYVLMIRIIDIWL